MSFTGRSSSISAFGSPGWGPLGLEVRARSKGRGNRRLPLIGISLAISLGLCAEPLGPPPQEPRSIEEILDLARVAPPEFGADALLALVEANLIRSPSRRLALVEEAFALAGLAGFRQKKRQDFGLRDTPEGFLDHAYSLNRDAESLRFRAVRSALRLDPRRAREWFESVADFRVAAHSCESGLTYDPTAAFEALGAVVVEGFDANERRSGRQWDFAERYLAGVASPVQVVPAMGLLAKLEAPREELARLVATFTEALRRMAADDRAFRDGYGLVEALEELAEQLHGRGLPAGPLVEAVRRHITVNLSGIRCADSARRSEAARRRHRAEEVVRRFNESKVRMPPYTLRDIPPIAAAEAEPKEVDGAPRDREYLSPPERRALLEAIQRPRYSAAAKPGERPALRSLEERMTPEWTSQLTEVLTKLEHRKRGDDEDEMSFFFSRCMPYYAILELVPEGSTRDGVLRAFVSCLVRSPLQQQAPVVWFVAADTLVARLRHSRLTSAAERRDAGQDVRWALSEFERSGSVILTLRAKLDALLPGRVR